MFDFNVPPSACAAPAALASAMSRVQELTRNGQLMEATAAIQAALQGRQPVAPTAATGPMPTVVPMPGFGSMRAAAMAQPASSALHAAAAAAVAATTSTATAAVRTVERHDAVDVTWRPSAEPASASSDVIRGTHTEPGIGTLRYRAVVPPQARAGGASLVVMLHGCTQDPDDFARGTRMDEAARRDGFIVVYPEQTTAANPQRCWNWFRAGHQSRDGGEPAMIAGLTRQLMREFSVDPARVHVAGLSAGGAMAAILGQAWPDLYASIGVHSGLPAGAASNVPTALAAMQGRAMPGALKPGVTMPGATMQRGPAGNGMRGSSSASHVVPTIVFHGDADTVVNRSNGDAVVAAATPVGSTTRTEEHAQRARPATRRIVRGPDGTVTAESWTIHGAPHAWAGGSASGSYTDPAGPDATAEMLRFFREHPMAVRQ